MNAKFILAAIAAICCVQGIAAASLSRAVTKDVAAFDLEDMDVDEVIERLSVVLDEALDDESEGVEGVSGSRNIITCATSVVGVYKTAKDVIKMYDEYRDDKKALKQATAACKVPAAEGEPTKDESTCIEEAKATYNAQFKIIKKQILPEVIKVATTLFSLKNCLTIF